MKKIISLLLTFALVLSLCTTAFAHHVTLDSKAVASNNETVSFLDMHHISRDKLVSIDEVGFKPKYVYQLTDAVRSEIVVEETANGRLLTIKEGNLINTLELTNDGRYILNGHTVTFSGSETAPVSNGNTVMPRYAVDTFYTDVCPYGTVNDYTRFVRSDAVANISFGVAFTNITLAAFTTIIGAVINPILGLSTTFALAILTSFQDYDPHSTCASYKENQYVHRTKGSYVTIEKSVLMYDMDLWPRANYQGDVVHRIAYKVTLWENGEG